MVAYVVGIDIGSVECSVACLHPDKRPVSKPRTFANTADGFALLAAQLTNLGVPPEQVLIGMEATGCYWENLYYFLEHAHYHLLLLHPAQTHQFAQQRGLRAKTDRLDAITIARALLSEDLRPAYVPNDLITSYRELVRMQTTLIEQATRHKLEMLNLLTLLFPEFTQVFADPCRPTAQALLVHYPSAPAFVAAGVAAVAATLYEIAPRRYGRQHAVRLVALAEQSVASGVARAARERNLHIVGAQLGQIMAHLAELATAIEELVQHDPAAGHLSSVPEFGPKTVAVLRAELGDVARFGRSDQAVAYVGLDVRVRESGKWRGQRKVSKRGSGRVRRALYLAAVACLTRKDSAFGAYYRHLVGQGVTKMSALMGVMRKMLLVAYRLLRSGQSYDATKVWAAPLPQPAAPPKETLAAA